jgi:hypothetical protein
VIARVIDQGSRLSAVRLAMSHAACDVLGLGLFDEDALYDPILTAASTFEPVSQNRLD